MHIYFVNFSNLHKVLTSAYFKEIAAKKCHSQTQN